MDHSQILEIPIIEIGKKTARGNIYTQYSINRILDLYYKEYGDRYGRKMWGEIADSESKDGEYRTAMVQVVGNGLSHSIDHMYIKDGFLIGIFKFSNNKWGKKAVSMLKSGEGKLIPTISGRVNPDTGEIIVENLISVDIIPAVNLELEKLEMSWIEIA
jgi:hypothetical protein